MARSDCFRWLWLVWVFGAPAVFSQSGPRGYVYATDPGFMNAAPVLEVTLARLRGPGDALDGEYVRVINKEWGDGAPTSSVGTDFLVLPYTAPFFPCITVSRSDHDCTSFDDINVYYHLDSFAHDFWVTRMGITPASPVTVFTHSESPNGALTYVLERRIVLSHGNLLGKDAAKENEILYHEYNHIIFHDLGFTYEGSANEEVKALHEGFADYFAATYTGDARIGNYIYDCPPAPGCVGPVNHTEIRTLETSPAVWNWNNGDPDVRLEWGLCLRRGTLDDKCKMSVFSHTAPYVWGMIWSGTLWDLREEMGSSKADLLLLESVKKLDPFNATFSSTLDIIIQADRDQHNGIHIGLIEQVFARRGIYKTSTDVSADRPIQNPYWFGTYPNPVSGFLDIGLPGVSSGRVDVKVFDMLGREVYGEQILDHRNQTRWQTAGVAGGYYIVSVRAGGTYHSQVVLVEPAR